MKRFSYLVIAIVLVLSQIAARLASPATLTVNSTGDAEDANPGNGACETATPGECTLRAAIRESNGNPGTDMITFSIPGPGPYTISPAYGFDTIGDPVIIDGTTQPGFAGTPIIELNGNSAVGSVDGLDIVAGNTTVRGLVINSFSLKAIDIETNSNNIIQGNFLGTDVTGTLDMGNGTQGMVIAGGSSGNLIGGTTAGARNVISGNGDWGIGFGDLGTSANVVQGNYIGTDASGTFAMANGGGVGIFTGSSGNQIGGTAPGAGNLISGNAGVGVMIGGSSTGGNIVQGNFVGTDVTGTVDLGNGDVGVLILDSASTNTVGGSAPGAGNLISGNESHGVRIADNASQNIVQGNFVGTDLTGTADLGNSSDGVGVYSDNNLIGGSASGARNVISGNDGSGVVVFGVNANDNVIQGNYIGTNASGTAALGNYGGAVVIGVNASDNAIGGTASGAGNLLSGNGDVGIAISDVGTVGNVMQGNLIGTDASGSASIPNNNGGVRISGGASNNQVGGTSTSARNLISGNGGSGVMIFDLGSTGNTVQGNFVGTDVTGTIALANADDGVLLLASNNTIGGTAAGARNVISANEEQGVRIQGPDASGNLVQGNFIGTDVTGTVALGNGRDGSHSGVVLHLGASNNTIGGTAAGAGNVISSNSADGVSIFDAGSTGNLVQGNFIGTDVTGTLSLGNTDNGVSIVDGPAQNTVGSGNVISGNGGFGVVIGYGGATQNTVQGNFIGTNAAGSAALPNINGGVGIFGPTSNNLIGGTTAAARNVISGNGSNGVNICCDVSTSNLVKGNFIGTDATGTLDLGNTGDGVSVFQAANNTIGGTEAAARNIISGNDSNGVGLYDAGTTGNLVQGNYLGTDVTGTIDLGNSYDGVVVCCGGASANVIGGTAAGAGNLISGNGQNGVGLYVGTNANVVQGNLIGTDANGTANIGNTGSGIGLSEGSASNLLGGAAAGARNIIAFNGWNGVSFAGDAGTGNAISSNSIFSNGGLGIDLGEDGVTANDILDPDSGPNNLQNFAVVGSVKTKNGTTSVEGTLASSRDTTYRVEIYSNDACDASGFGEGRTFLGWLNVTTNHAGNASFKLTFGLALPVGTFVTSTVTDPSGNTSEFSKCAKSK